MLLHGRWTEITKALERGDIKAGRLNGIQLNGKIIEAGAVLETEIAVYQGDDGTVLGKSKWIVGGFNGAIPEHVKYMSDIARYFVKSTNDDDMERAIQVGDIVYARRWNKDSLSYDYDEAGTVESMEGEFKYGDTNTDYGTVSIKDPYTVPGKIIVRRKNGTADTALFAGHNMQLWSNQMLDDADAFGDYETAAERMGDSTWMTTMKFGPSHHWHESYVRAYLNGIQDISYAQHGGLWTNQPNWYSCTSYTVKHSLLEKANANYDAFLQNVCAQVNRNWTTGGEVVRTIDRFWLCGCDLLKEGMPSFSWVSNDKIPDLTNGLCAEPALTALLAQMPSMSGGFGLGYRWLRSAYDDGSYRMTQINGKTVNLDLSYGAFNLGLGISPACSIG